MINDIGELTGRKDKACQLTEKIKAGFTAFEENKPPFSKPAYPPSQSFGGARAAGRPGTAYLIWQKPYMTVGGDTFINDLLEKC